MDVHEIPTKFHEDEAPAVPTLGQVVWRIDGNNPSESSHGKETHQETVCTAARVKISNSSYEVGRFAMRFYSKLGLGDPKW